MSDLIQRLGALIEGVEDPNIFKAIWMAGGPGSGKSWVSAQLFGVDESLAVSMSSSTGLKLVASDVIFEVNLRKMGMNPADLMKLSDDEFEAMTVPADSPRGRARKTRDKAKAMWMRGRLGIVVDGTGSKHAKIAKDKANAEKMGYQTGMVFVDTSLEVAQERNAARPRKLNVKLVEKMWHEVQGNKAKYKAMFGSGFVLVDNSDRCAPNEKCIPIQKAMKAARKLLRKKVNNPIAKAWMAVERRKKTIR